MNRAVAVVEQHPSVPRRLVLLFAVACGITVANLYYIQPLVAVIAHRFHTNSATAGLVITVTLVGYALGLAFLVPLGDLLERRRLIVTLLSATTIALLGAMLAPSIAVLVVASLGIGMTCVAAQILVPFAASLASDNERGRLVGTVMSGLLLGVLLGRTFSGLLAQVAGWRAVYGVAAIVMLALIFTLWRTLPHREQLAEPLSYGALLLSVLRLVRDEPLIRRRAFYGAVVWAIFNVFWTSAAFLLSRPPFNYSQAAIGLLGLAGIFGALLASYAGRLADRGWARYSTAGFLLMALISYGFLALGGKNIGLLVVGIILMDMGVQGTHITNQAEVYRIRPEARSRITTAYMTAYFAGGAIGSATSTLIFSREGWLGVCLLGGAYTAAGLLFWLTELRQRGSRLPATRSPIAQK